MTNPTDTRTSDVEPTEFEVAVVALLNQVSRGETDLYEAGKAFMKLNRENTEKVVAEESERIFRLFKDHYWDSLESERGIIIAHISATLTPPKETNK